MEELSDNINEIPQDSDELAGRLLPYVIGSSVVIAGVTLYSVPEAISHVVNNKEALDSDNVISSIIGPPAVFLSVLTARFLHRRS